VCELPGVPGHRADLTDYADGQVRDKVRAQMRLLIKRLLRKYKYPREGQEAAVQLVLEQAEALADAWTGEGA
jgi:type I restriction enzyme, R subunit